MIPLVATRLTAMVLLAALLAGCASSNGPQTGAPSASTPSASSPGASSPPAAFFGVHLRHNYTDAEETRAFEIPDAGPFKVAIHFSAIVSPDGAQACTGGTARLVVKAPDGHAYADVSDAGAAAGNGACEGSGRFESGAFLASGAWKAEFTGSGAVAGVVDIAR